MPDVQPTIRALDAEQALHVLPDLCAVLVDCVEGGASVGYVLPFTMRDAEPFWRGVIGAVGRGEILLYGAFAGERLIATVQVGFALKPNQPHRADLMKLLVQRDQRRQGLSTALMLAAEQGARLAGRTLLVLDTAAGEPAELLYEKLGWQRAGAIPDYAQFPDRSFCDAVFFYKRLM